MYRTDSSGLCIRPPVVPSHLLVPISPLVLTNYGTHAKWWSSSCTYLTGLAASPLTGLCSPHAHWSYSKTTDAFDESFIFRKFHTQITLAVSRRATAFVAGCKYTQTIQYVWFAFLLVYSPVTGGRGMFIDQRTDSADGRAAVVC